MPMEDLEGLVAVVTGGGSGVGRALILGFAGSGMHTVVADIDPDAAETVAREAATFGPRSLSVRTDVADHASVVALADACYDTFGAVDVLCNNAGVLVFKGFGDSIVEDWQWLYGVNVMGTIHGVLAFLPRMQAGGGPGHIVNTSSVAALGATGVYGTSKATILTLTDALADELEGSPIRASVLLPGMVRSQIVDAERNRPDHLGRRIDDPTRAFAGLVGLDPALCAEAVLEALRSGRRYVFAGIPEGAFDLETEARRRFDGLMGEIASGVVPDPG
jgi:NAD(P)-dependent dehydrogenase (short-subunit alcohol dehydrogenase family)